MLTYQDYEKETNKGTRNVGEFLLKAIQEHKESDDYKTAVLADLYDHQKNKTINEYVKMIYKVTGVQAVDYTASNAKLANNYFHKLSRQRCTYSLGNGVHFTRHVEKRMQDGVEISVDTTSEQLPSGFGAQLYKLAHFGLIHGVSFAYRGVERMFVFPVTQFCPFWDENDGSLRAGARFWQVDSSKPMTVELYEEDGSSQWRANDKGELTQTAEKRPYRIDKVKAKIEDESTISAEENYGGKLPIVPFWGSDLHQSLLTGNQQTLDSYDLINSGFANNVQDCATIYWLLENYGGMSPEAIETMRQRMLLTHVVSADTSNGGKLTAYTPEIHYEAHKERLESLRSQIYEDLSCLDVHTIAAGATNDHIDAAYQPVDDAADDFEYQIREFLEAYLALYGIEDTPEFKRNRISNQREKAEILSMARADLDRQTFLSKYPFVSPDEVPGIISRLDEEGESLAPFENDEQEDEEEE